MIGSTTVSCRRNQMAKCVSLPRVLSSFLVFLSSYVCFSTSSVCVDKLRIGFSLFLRVICIYDICSVSSHNIPIKLHRVTVQFSVVIFFTPLPADAHDNIVYLTLRLSTYTICVSGYMWFTVWDVFITLALLVGLIYLCCD